MENREIEREIEELSRFVRALEKKGISEVEGSRAFRNIFHGTGIQCKKINGSYEFFNKNHYIQKKDLERDVKSILQPRYESAILTVAQRRIKNLTDFEKKIAANDLDAVFDDMYPGYKQIITPIYKTKKEIINEFESEDYEGLPFDNCKTEIYTAKNERVRSRAEKIIADTLMRNGIPYRYERPLKLDVRGVTKIFYPDFTIYVASRKKYAYLEYLGLLDNQSYSENAFSKLDIYERNGLLLGRDIFFLHESAGAPFNTKILDEYIDAFWT